MANERRSKGASEILKTLHSLSLDTEDEILAMSRDEVRACLQQEGIDPDVLATEMGTRFNVIRGRARLSAARQQREALNRTLVHKQIVNALNLDEIKIQVEEKLGLLFPTQTQAAKVYYNRFKEASDEDLPGLLEDLSLLDALNAEGEEL